MRLEMNGVRGDVVCAAHTSPLRLEADIIRAAFPFWTLTLLQPDNR